MKKFRVFALVLAVMMLFSSVALAYEYSWRYSSSTLKKGHGGSNSSHLRPYVANVQGDVNYSGKGDCGSVDGIYGNNTVSGVKSYQRKTSGLSVDGQTGYNTKTSLYSFGQYLSQWSDRKSVV